MNLFKLRALSKSLREYVPFSDSEKTGLMAFYEDDSPIVTPKNYQFNDNLVQFWRTRSDVKVLKGGRASGKTWDTAAMSVYLASTCTLRFLCVRQFQNNINDSVYAVIKDSIERLGYSSEFTVLKNSIVNKKTGSNFIFYGFQKHTASIKGMEAIDVLWIEEGESLTAEQWGIIEPTIRKENSECWLIYNPRLVSDFPERHFKSGKGVLVRHINYDENPFLSDKIKRTIEKVREHDFESYQHVYLGVPKSDDNAVFIKRSWIESAIDAHKKLDMDFSGVGIIGFDVADAGEDFNATVVCNGSEVVHLDEWRGGEDGMIESTLRVMSTAKTFCKKKYIITYDSIGVGASIGAILNEKSFFDHNAFNASSSVKMPNSKYSDTEIKNSEKFCNLKAQAWQIVADKLKNTYLAVSGKASFEPEKMISINTKHINKKLLSKLIDEISTPRIELDNYGRTKVESKKDLAKRGIKSPNLADAFIMACCKDIIFSGNFFDLDWSGYARK